MNYLRTEAENDPPTHPKTLTQQANCATYPSPMSGPLDSGAIPKHAITGKVSCTETAMSGALESRAWGPCKTWQRRPSADPAPTQRRPSADPPLVPQRLKANRGRGLAPPERGSLRRFKIDAAFQNERLLARICRYGTTLPLWLRSWERRCCPSSPATVSRGTK
jgi:hypothetical protein